MLITFVEFHFNFQVSTCRELLVGRYSLETGLIRVAGSESQTRAIVIQIRKI